MPSREPFTVRPRVRAVDNAQPLPLDEAVMDILSSREFAVIEIIGREGAGKTTALRYLDDVLGRAWRIKWLDEPNRWSVELRSRSSPVIYTTTRPLDLHEATSLRLASWSEDDWIDYLLPYGNEACKSVLARLRNAADGDLMVYGSARLHAMVLDRMLDDSDLCNVADAIRREWNRGWTWDDKPHATTGTRAVVDRIWSKLRGCFAPSLGTRRQGVEQACFFALSSPRRGERRVAWRLARMVKRDKSAMYVLSERAVVDVLAAEHSLRAIRDGWGGELLSRHLKSELVSSIARLALGDATTIATLRDLADRHAPCAPMAASILLRAGEAWTPSDGANLAAAYLDGANWPNASLSAANLRNARLMGASLPNCDLRGAWCSFANLGRACLDEATMADAKLGHANLSGASLRGARLNRAHLKGARLSRADLTAAILRQANLDHACFAGARLVRADLTRASLVGANLADADFTYARLGRANLSGLDLTQARWEGANFEFANLVDTDLTALTIPSARFRGAKLRGARMAEINMPDADLRDADLREVVFHFGGTRNGLVGSTIACEGSRTGFYTDEALETHFKSVEDIRKANLMGADLRGARIEGTDFYLVDLRGAKYDPSQVEHLARTGAILHDWTTA